MRRLANAKDDKRLGIIRIHRGIVCLSPSESHSHTHTHRSKCSRFFPTSYLVYVYIHKSMARKREKSLLLLAADSLQHKQLGCYCYGRRLNCLTLLQFKLSKEINTRHIKHQQPSRLVSLSSLRFGHSRAGVAFNSLLLRLSEWDALLWIKTKRRLNAVSVRSAPMHFSRNGVVWTTMKERIEMFHKHKERTRLNQKSFWCSALAILIDFSQNASNSL